MQCYRCWHVLAVIDHDCAKTLSVFAFYGGEAASSPARLRQWMMANTALRAPFHVQAAAMLALMVGKLDVEPSGKPTRNQDEKEESGVQ